MALSRARRADLLRVQAIESRIEYQQIASTTSSPATITAAIRETKTGAIRRQVETVCEIRNRKDLHLRGVEQTRRAAVCGKPWEVLPTKRRGVETRAEVVDAVLDMLHSIPEWPQAIGQMQDAVSQPLSALELQWAISEGQAWPIHLRWVHPKKFKWNTIYEGSRANDGTIPELGELRLWTENDQELGERLRPDCWLIHQTDGPGDYPWNAGLGGLLLWYEGFKSFTWAQWMTFLERCATPVPVATMADGTGTAELALVEAALGDLNGNSYAVMKGTSSLEWLVANSAGDESFQRMGDAINLEVTKAYLGHTGAADSTPGALGGQDLAGEIRQDLVESDARGIESSTLRGLIEPFVRLNYGPLEPPPRLHIQVDALTSRREVMDLAGKAWSYGMPVDMEWLASTTGIMLTKDPSRILPAPGPQGMAQSVAGITAPQPLAKEPA